MDNPYAPPAADPKESVSGRARRTFPRVPILLWTALTAHGFCALNLFSMESTAGIQDGFLFAVSGGLFGLATVAATIDYDFSTTAAAIGAVGQLVALTTTVLIAPTELLSRVLLNAVFIVSYGLLSVHYANQVQRETQH